MNKKSFLLIIMLVVSTSIFAQQSRPVYCDVMAFNFWGFGKVNITIDLGENRYGTICDDKGKATKFNTTIDALNYMSKLGWSVKDTYFLSSDMGKQKVLHFLLVKQVTDDSQISEGIYVKPKKKKEPYKPGKNGDDMY
jgi:hypothetical protein|nr:MAG TPA: hypothetical protein [Caudoviricetes sp.]